MNSTDPDRNSDLEWMLGSGREDEQALVKFLIENQYNQVFNLCQAILADPQLANEASRQALAAAVVSSHRYTGRNSAPAWIYRLAVNACQDQYQAALPVQRLVRLLHQEMDLTAGDIAYVLDISELAVRAELEAPEPEGRGSGQTDWPAKPPGADGPLHHGMTGLDSQQVQDEVFQLVQLTRQRRRFSARFQEATLVGLGVLLAILLGRAAFASLPTPAGPAAPTQPALITTQEVLVYSGSGELSPGNPIPERRIVFEARAGDTLASISELTGVALTRLLALNDLPPEKPLQPGQPVVIALAAPQVSQITPTPVTPVPPPESLTRHTNPEAIRQRILYSHKNWNTLWAEAEIRQYGPSGYVGPPKIRFQQVWISQPDYSLSLSGRADGEVEIAIQASAGQITSLNNQTGDRTLLTRNLLVNYIMPIHELLLPTRMRTDLDGILIVAGEDMVAGRPALVVDWFETGAGESSASESPAGRLHRGRFWVDEIKGLVLRRQTFHRDQPGLIAEEVIVTQVRFDLPLANRFFDPEQPLPTRMYLYTGGNPLSEHLSLRILDLPRQPEREPLPRRTPPSDLDPAGSRLQFQWTSLAELDPSQPTRADVFADDYYLGTVGFGDPRSLSCKRSPDGKLVAFTEWFEEPPYGARPLRWFNLESLHTIYEPMPDLISGNFAFSPDSQRLALFACKRSLQGCGIHILDLETGTYRQVVEMAFAGSLGWRPDGEQLAFRGAKKPREESSLWVIDAGSGAIIYNGPLVPESGQPAGKSPLPGWGSVFQRPVRGADGCSEPPGG